MEDVGMGREIRPGAVGDGLPPGWPGGPIYLDYNATTPVDARVAEAARPYLDQWFGNPSSGHACADRPRQAVARAREQVAALIGASPDEIVFTGSGSEADQLAIRGAVLTALRRMPGSRPRVITQVTEHPAVLASCDALERWHGAQVTRLPVDQSGLVADLLTVVGHKVYAPKGVAALYVRAGVELEPVIYGGGQERGLRAGTENVALIAALGAAAELAIHDLAEGSAARLAGLRDRLHRALAAALPARIELNGPPDRRLPRTLNVSIIGLRGHDLLAATPGVAASTGSACHSGQHTPSPVLTAMGLDENRALAAIRLSAGRWTAETEIDDAAGQLAAEIGRASCRERV